ncbi:MAG: rRNA maturation RNase YbeY [Candidatus Pelagibacterales bacterium]|tara:strand:+ start:1083 stop:1532 length:450 start_codon:yes stop_codon:yes gene_type:complete
MVEISYNIKSLEWNKNLPSYKKCISNSVNQIFKIIKFSSNNEISISFLLTSNSEIKLLNQKYRNKNKPTNVLSFPMNEKIENKNYLGDVVISCEKIIDESYEQNIKKYKYLSKMTIHGVLHLLGYKHDTDRQFNKMNSIEKNILEEMYK